MEGTVQPTVPAPTQGHFRVNSRATPQELGGAFGLR